MAKLCGQVMMMTLFSAFKCFKVIRTLFYQISTDSGTTLTLRPVEILSGSSPPLFLSQLFDSVLFSLNRYDQVGQHQKVPKKDAAVCHPRVI